MAAEAQTCAIGTCAIGIITILNIFAALYLSRVLYKPTLFMHTKRSGEPDVFSENKPNLLNAQMNVNKVLTKDYENERHCRGFKNKAKQTQSNPIQSQYKANSRKAKNEIKLLFHKGL